MTRIPGTPFTDDAPIPGSKADKIQNLERELSLARAELESIRKVLNPPEIVPTPPSLAGILKSYMDGVQMIIKASQQKDKRILELEAQVDRFRDDARERRERIYGEDI